MFKIESRNEVYRIFYVYTKQDTTIYAILPVAFTLCIQQCNFYKFEDVGKMIITRKSFLKEVSLQMRYLLYSRFESCISTKDDESTP